MTMFCLFFETILLCISIIFILLPSTLSWFLPPTCPLILHTSIFFILKTYQVKFVLGDCFYMWDLTLSLSAVPGVTPWKKTGFLFTDSNGNLLSWGWDFLPTSILPQWDFVWLDLRQFCACYKMSKNFNFLMWLWVLLGLKLHNVCVREPGN